MCDALLSFELPWPPSANRYWRHYQGRTIISQEAREYKRLVHGLSYSWNCDLQNKPLALIINAFPPDRRKRDLDNLLKVTIDAIAATGVMNDDSQIDHLSITRRRVNKPGKLDCKLYEFIKIYTKYIGQNNDTRTIRSIRTTCWKCGEKVINQ